MNHALPTNQMTHAQYRAHLEQMHDTFAGQAHSRESLNMMHERQHKDADLTPLTVDHIHRGDI